MPKMQTSFDGLVSLLAKNLYTSPDVFIRELIQNAHDGCQRALALDHERRCRIDITTAPDIRQITFSDNGVGMDAGDIQQYLSTIGRSGTATETQQLRAQELTAETIGQFGVGLLSAFVVAERIDVFTRKTGSDTGFHWVSHGGEDYEVNATSEAPDAGTEITLTLRKAYQHFLDPKDLAGAIRLHADFLNVPIHLNGEGPVNSGWAPWDVAHWTSGEAEQEAIRSFLDRRYGDIPLLIIPVETENPRARGVLYVTSQPLPGLGPTGQVDLYVRRMCIRHNDTDLLPDWAKFIRGVIDVDLTPTAARDNVQRNPAYHRLRHALGETIVRSIMKLNDRDPEGFQRLCLFHHVGIKGMALRHEDFFRSVIRKLPFVTNEGTLSLDEFLAKQKPTPAGRKPLFYFSYMGDETRFFQICSAGGLVGINAGLLFDEPILREFAKQNPREVELRRMDTLDSEEIYAKPDPETQASFEQFSDNLTRQMTQAGVEQVRVTLRDFPPESMACVLIEPSGNESLERLRTLLSSPHASPELRDFARGVKEQLNTRPVEMIVNSRNPFVRMLRDLPVDDQCPELLQGLYLLGLINSEQRDRSGTARQLDAYLQDQLSELIQHKQKLCELQQKAGAWRRCATTPEQASSADWSDTMQQLTGTTPAEFRRKVTTATDEQLAGLILQTYQQLSQG